MGGATSRDHRLIQIKQADVFEPLFWSALRWPRIIEKLDRVYHGRDRHDLGLCLGRIWKFREPSAIVSRQPERCAGICALRLKLACRALASLDEADSALVSDRPLATNYYVVLDGSGSMKRDAVAGDIKMRARQRKRFACSRIVSRRSRMLG